MDSRWPLVAKNPRLVAGEAEVPFSGKPRRPGLTRLIVLVALAGAGAAAWGIHRAMASRGTLRITTKPAGATINIDGMTVSSEYPEDATWNLDGMEIVWSLPLTVHRQPGTYDITVTVPGWVTRAARVDVKAGQTTSVDLELAPITDMRLEVATEPSGRDVDLDGHPVMAEPDHRHYAKTPLTVYAIRPGEHEVTVGGDCRYLDWVQKVQLHPGTITRVEATMQPRPFAPTGCSEAEWRGTNARRDASP